MNYMMSRAATYDQQCQLRSITVTDVKTAFLYGKAKRRVYIRIPPEDSRSRHKGKVALLRKALYGTQGASQTWQDEIRSTLKDIGIQ